MNDLEFETNIGCHRESLRRFIMCKLRNDTELTEDIVQLSLIKAYKYVKNYNCNIVSYKPWLFKIAVNVIIDYYKNKKNIISLDSSINDDFEIKDNFSFDKHIDNMVYNDLIEESLNKLRKEKPDIYSVFNTYLNSDNYSQVAEIENIQLATVKTRIHRARTFIKNYLDNKVVFD